MSELRFPLCPICKEEYLLPFSVAMTHVPTKAFAHWICINCGFCLTSGRNMGYNVEKDIEAKFLPKLITRIKSLKQTYQKINTH